jgi:trehalose 6-phosphate phosphatase
LSREASHTPDPTDIPVALPNGLIAERLAHGHLLLCLDFDGTISELTDDPWKAVPVPRAKDAIAELARRRDRLTVAIVSGRDLDTLLRLLGLHDGLLFAGTHGLECIGPDGARHFTPGVERCTDDLARVRDFLADEIPRDRGFIIEDKRVALTLNYRNAQPEDARAALALFDDFVQVLPTLQLLQGKMVHEAVPRGIGGKGEAIEALMRDAGVAAAQAAYFGDDTTDEDAFHALVPQGGIGVLVGVERASFAQYRLDSPSQVADVLVDLAAAVAISPPLSF